MATEFQRAITFMRDGELRDDVKDNLLLCPLTLLPNGRRNHCTNQCAWFGIDETQHVAKCGNKIIGKIAEAAAG
jgi:hypothetical protein